MTTATTAIRFQVGQRVYSGLYGGRRGIVYAIHGEQRPETIRSIGGVMSTGGSAYLDVVFDNGGISRQIPECIVRGVQWEIYPEVATAEEIAAALKHAAETEARKKVEAEETAKRRALEREKHAADNPHLLKHSDRPAWGERRLVAENIRRALKRAFPGVKFSVTSEHNSVRVGWTCGPTRKEVARLADRHEEGSFDGMNDIYVTNHDATFADVFGGVKYVFYQRDFPEDALEVCYRQMAEFYGVAYNGSRTRERDGYRDVSELVGLVLGKSPLGATLTRLERIEGVNAGLVEDFWRAV